MTAAIIGLIVFVATISWLVAWAFRSEREHARRRHQEVARYRQLRAEFLANATPAEAHAFLLQEAQTNALIDAQHRASLLVASMIWLNGANSPFHGHHRH